MLYEDKIPIAKYISKISPKCFFVIPTASYKFQAPRPSLSENTKVAQNTLWVLWYHKGPSNQISIKSPLYSNTLTSVSVHFG